MEQFTIRCTPEQTMMALELGAPIYNMPSNISVKGIGWTDYKGKSYLCPTAEQMTVWLEEQHHIRFNVSIFGGNDDAVIFFLEDRRKTFYRIRRSYKEALLAAIDEALAYLIQTKSL